MNDEEKQLLIDEYRHAFGEESHIQNRYENVAQFRSVGRGGFQAGAKDAVEKMKYDRAISNIDPTDPMAKLMGQRDIPKPTENPYRSVQILDRVYNLEKQSLDALARKPLAVLGQANALENREHRVFSDYQGTGAELAKKYLTADSTPQDIENFVQNVFTQEWKTGEKLARDSLLIDEAGWGPWRQDALNYLESIDAPLKPEELNNLQKIAFSLIHEGRGNAFPGAVTFADKYMDGELVSVPDNSAVPTSPKGIFNSIAYDPEYIINSPELLEYIACFSQSGETVNFIGGEDTFDQLSCVVDALMGAGYTLDCAFERIISTVAQHNINANPREIADLTRQHFEDIDMPLTNEQFDDLLRVTGLRTGEELHTKTASTSDTPSTETSFGRWGS